ncbi:hypothetical protein QQS21_007561 [Conoideocrella luteorostrata]|uniref:Ankyrin n=1 Tax=Conoideocrella luteorostrata TaxID=1105319 RepID=A0AAJ0CPT8_9HYPO|nr:hypothetical protein QQS21_007561 [Conoideocrella luteorostrata]
MILNLPLELLQNVADHLEVDRDVNALARTHSRLYAAANPVLYRDKYDAMAWAAEKGRVSTAEMILSGCPRLGVREEVVNYKPNLLSLAARKGHADMVRWLLGNNADINQGDWSIGQTPLLQAISQNHFHVVKVLLAAPGIDVNLAGGLFQFTPLSLAAETGQEETVKLLMESPLIDLNAPDKSGATPLECAAGMGHVSVVKLLLDSGRVTNGSDQIGSA